MNASERILKCLNGEKTDLIPFTTYRVFLRHCDDPQSLVRRGMGIVHPVYSVKMWMEGVEVKRVEYTDGARRMVKTVYSTPVGDVYTLKETDYHSEWTKEYMFKIPDDYKVLKYMYSHQRFSEDYDTINKLQAELDGDVYILRDNIPLEPLQQFISWDVMDCSTFALEWCDNRDELMELYRHNAAFHEQLFPVIAKSPVSFACYGGNVIPQIIGPDVFRDLYVPHYNMAADIFHDNGKLIGSHLDGDNTPVMDLIGSTRLDHIEAYDPSISPPLRVAKEKFKDKKLWINWPSGEHCRDASEIAGITRDLVEDYGAEGGLLMAVTEDLPKGRWDEILHAIMDGLSYPG